METKSMSYNKTKTVQSFADSLRLAGLKEITVAKHLHHLKLLSDSLKNARISELDADAIKRYILDMQAKGLSRIYTEDNKLSIKKFYEFLNRKEIVSWMKPNKNVRSKVAANDVIDMQEVFAMIDAAETKRDKAIIALLSDAGLRPGELLGMRIEDVDFREPIAHVHVDGKTGRRGIPLTFSAGYLLAYLDSTPRLRGIGSAFWVSERGTGLGYEAIRKVIRKAKAKAGIEKRIYPYLFRHSSATKDARKMSDSLMRLKFGWSARSQMPAVYVHLDSRALDEFVMAKN